MVFGSCYCPISNLPIHDGDVCVMFPLSFELSFSGTSESEVFGSFLGLFQFRGKPMYVRYKGNFSFEFEYNSFIDGEQIDEIRLRYYKTTPPLYFMLVHQGIYKAIVENYGYKPVRSSDLTKCYALKGIYAHIYEDELRDSNNYLLAAQKATTQQEKDYYSNLYMNPPLPQWTKDVFKIAFLMQKMGKPIAPNDANDQDETYNFLQKCIKKIKYK